jgi:hypothetical protein
MSSQTKAQWNNYTLPTNVPGRANAEIVWIPVSKQGILVAIGGVIFPAYANVNQTDTPAQKAQSVCISLPILKFDTDICSNNKALHS